MRCQKKIHDCKNQPLSLRMPTLSQREINTLHAHAQLPATLLLGPEGNEALTETIKQHEEAGRTEEGPRDALRQTVSKELG